MDKRERDQLIDQYYAALDEASYEVILEIFTEDVLVEYSIGDLAGVDEAIHYYREQRRIRDTNHRIDRRIHADDVTICEGTATGEIEDGPMRKYFADFFEFDADCGRIDHVSVYLRHRDEDMP